MLRNRTVLDVESGPAPPPWVTRKRMGMGMDPPSLPPGVKEGWQKKGGLFVQKVAPGDAGRQGSQRARGPGGSGIQGPGGHRDRRKRRPPGAAHKGVRAPVREHSPDLSASWAWISMGRAAQNPAARLFCNSLRKLVFLSLVHRATKKDL